MVSSNTVGSKEACRIRYEGDGNKSKQKYMASVGRACNANLATYRAPNISSTPTFNRILQVLLWMEIYGAFKHEYEEQNNYFV